MINKSLKMHNVLVVYALLVLMCLFPVSMVTANSSSDYSNQFSGVGVISSLDIEKRSIVVGNKKFDLSYSIEVHHPNQHVKAKLADLAVGMEVGYAKSSFGTLSDIWMIDGLD